MQKPKSCVGVNDIRQVDKQIHEQPPAYKGVQKTDRRAKTENGLEENRLEDHLSQPLPDYIPIRLTLSACNMTDDAHHAAIGEVQRDNNAECEEDFLYQSEHRSSINFSPF